MTVLLFALLIAFGGSFLCSIMEASLLSLTPGKLALIESRRPSLAKICKDLKANIEKPIAVILILNTTAHTFGAAISGAQFDKMTNGHYLWLFSLIFTLLMVQYTEILPKTIGVRFSHIILPVAARPLRFFVKIFSPLITLIHFVNSPFEKLCNTKKSKDDIEDETMDELDAIATSARKEDYITSLQEHAIKQIPDLTDNIVSSIMIPTSQMCSVSIDMTEDDILVQVVKCRHSRYPVKDSTKPYGFAGILEIRELLFYDGDWKDLIKPISIIEDDLSQLHIAENLTKLDSKLLLVKGDGDSIIGMLTVNNLFMSLFDNSDKETK